MRILLSTIMSMQLLLILAVIGADQLTKNILQDYAVENLGIAFGLLSDYPSSVVVVVVMATVLALHWAAQPASSKLQRVAWSLLIGGLLSNIIDRARFGAVIDVLSIGSWMPMFNLADVAILVGLGTLAYLEVQQRTTRR